MQTGLMRIDDENDFIWLAKLSHMIVSMYREEFVLDKTTYTSKDLIEI